MKEVNAKAKVSGILFGIMAAIQLYSMLRGGNLKEGINVWGLLYLIAFLAMATVLLTGQNRKIVVYVVLALTALVGIIFILGFTNHAYEVYSYSYSFRTKESTESFQFHLLAFIPGLLRAAGYAFLVYAETKGEEKLKKYWMLPGLGAGLYVVLGILNYFILTWLGRGYWLGAPMNVLTILIHLLECAALLFLCLYLFWPEGLPQSERSMDGVAAGEGYYDLTKHALLLLLTCGIWQFIWVYRVTGYTNHDETQPYRDPTKKLLLFLFVPFYAIYWFHKTALRIDRIAKSRGLYSNQATLCLILAIAFPIGAAILMQDTINQIALGETSLPAGGAQETYSAVKPLANGGLGGDKAEAAESGQSDESVALQEMMSELKSLL